MPPTFLAFSLSFLYPMPLWKVGAQFVKKHCIHDAKKSFFCCVLQCFVNLNILPQDTQKSANPNLELSPPPTPPPSKTYRGETQSDIHRFPSSSMFISRFAILGMFHQISSCCYHVVHHVSTDCAKGCLLSGSEIPFHGHFRPRTGPSRWKEGRSRG